MIPRFGTDGLRGAANDELTVEVALALGRASVDVIGPERILVARDTRISGPMLEAGFSAGVCSAGVDTQSLGVVPTPALAWACADQRCAGAMISASHNPYVDNGIKLFDAGGLKLSDAVENEIQDRYMQLLTQQGGWRSAEPTEVGRFLSPTKASGWVDHIVSSVSTNALAGLNLVLDCAHGAASGYAAEVFARLGANLTLIGDQPDGVNINDGYGSTSPKALQAKVEELGADVGLAFDGDADRVVAVDNHGSIVDGDRVIGLLALDWSSTGRLTANTVVVTVMTNLGFHRAMAAAGIEVVSAPVGDRWVLAAIDDGGFSLGGEQSGHVICRDLATTGDGVLTGVQLLDLLVRSNRPLADLAEEIMTPVPQILRNIKLPRRDFDAGSAIADDVSQLETEFSGNGRILVRASGTEPLLRIMVEHLDKATAESACEKLVKAANRAIETDG